jgi:serine/threonine protein kinase
VGKKNGRLRKKGDKRSTPEAAVAAAERREPLEVAWYGGGRRQVEVVIGTGQWHKSGAELVELVWVYVHDLTGIRPDRVAEADLRGRFVLEAEINGGLEHPGIVPVYSLGTYDDGRPFYAMRFVEGDSLTEAIESSSSGTTTGCVRAVTFGSMAWAGPEMMSM